LGTFELAVVNAEILTVTVAADELPAHPWIPRQLLAGDMAAVEPGSIVALASPSGNPLGLATWNPASHAPMRLLSRTIEAVNVEWFVRRLQGCLDVRTELVKNGEAFRWVYGEADMLPGLVIDRYGDGVAVQVRSLAMERCKPTWLEALSTFNVSLVVERSDYPGRRSEGLEPVKEILIGGGATVQLVRRGGLEFEVDMLNGPKTGLYLDQLATSLHLQQHVRPGDRVADVFCSVGQLSVAAAKAGGKVTAVDIDSGLAATVARNAALNGVTVDFLAANAFEWLASIEDESMDWIILDPPAIAKHRGQRRALLGAIYKLSHLSFKKLRRSGRLIACSCSYQISLRELVETCNDAVKGIGKRQKAQSTWGQAADHPCPAWFPEARYLNVAELILE